MLNNIRLATGLFTFFFWSVYPQVSSAVDTVFQFQDGNGIQLKHPFILESSVKILKNDKPVQVKSVDSIEGIVTLPDTSIQTPFIIRYDYLTNGLPLSVGPKWKSLPPLSLDQSPPVRQEKIFSSAYNKESNLFSSGNIYRQLTVSPVGGSDFTGGLQMQLNGKLTKNLMVSGVLNDQDLPIQPEGTTRELEELDQVFLTVTHPNYTVDAGDIFLKTKLHNKQNINRKLVGLKNNFKVNDWSGNAVYANSKGNFKSMEMKGRDGDQGPYQLTSKNGNLDIIVLSGTEKVWVDGKKCIRGQNHDYTIDYSLGEILFTPKILIHSDSDIFIEYEYSDFEYQKGMSGGSMKKEFGKNGTLNFGFFRELDQFQESDWSQEIRDSLTILDGGSIQVNTAVIKEDGAYIQQEGVFKYDPDKIFHDTVRYTVTFEYDKLGNYVRQISDKGRIFYEFVDWDKTSNYSTADRYSPFRTIHAPKSHGFGFVGGELKLGKYLKIASNLTGSRLNQNNFSSLGKSTDGIATSFLVNVDSLDWVLGLLNVSISDWNRSADYFSLGQENDVQQRRFWNLDSTLNQDVRESKINSELILPSYGNTNIEIARLNHQNISRSRFYLNQQITHSKFANSFLNYRSIQKPSGAFKRSRGRIQFHLSNLSPFITGLTEEETNFSRFQNIGSGIRFQNNDKNIETGVDLRKDESFISSWEPVSDDFIGFVNFTSRSQSGWSQDVIFKKRFKSFESGLSNHDYSLAKVTVGYNQRHKPLRWEIQAKSEESLSEERAIIYDSVGTGLGQFRYDPVFNTYVADPNGAYISYAIPTGKRDPATVMEGFQRFTLDLGKMPGFPNVLIQGHHRLDYRGVGSEFRQLFQPELTDSTTSRSRLDSRLEILHAGKRRVLGWVENQHDLNGLDPRGNDFEQKNIVGIEIDQSVSKTSQIKTLTKFRTKSVESNISELRNRDMEGWWNESQFQVRMNPSVDFDVGIMGGFDSGTQQGESFSARAVGYLFNGRYFFKKTGRFQTRISWVKTINEKNGEILPPESLNGYPVKSSFRSNTRFQYFLNRSVSMIFTLNTIDDSRYKNFVTFQGEIRAHF